MNRLIIIGNLTADPTSRTTQAGKDVCSFTVAVNRRRKVEGQPEADFFRVSAWGKMAETCQKYLSKGRKVAVVGSISVSTYQAQDGTTRASMDVFAEDVEFLSPAGNGGAETAQNGSKQAAPAGYTEVTVFDGELPF